jgi:putative ABC transport system substrate-binding protein
MNNVIIWDIETVPDLKGFAAANGHAAKSDDEIRAAMGDKFPKHIYHSIVCIGALVAHRDSGGPRTIDALGAPHVGERPEKALIASFVDRIAELSPQLVTFNGSSFDLPVLRYRARAAVAEVVPSNPDVVYATATPIVQELQRRTRSIPIVFVSLLDPVETGVVASLARPGGNATGFMNIEPALSGKWLELLKEVAPGVNRVLVLANSGNDANLIVLRTIEAAAASFGVQVSSGIVRDASEIENAIEAIAGKPNAGLIVTTGIPINDRRKLIFALASRYRLPAVYTWRFFTVDGGLLSYGPDDLDMYRRSATCVDRVLKGEKPSDLPVQAPVKYELVINLNAAKAIGLIVPATLVARANEIIE